MKHLFKYDYFIPKEEDGNLTLSTLNSRIVSAVDLLQTSNDYLELEDNKKCYNKEELLIAVLNHYYGPQKPIVLEFKNKNELYLFVDSMLSGEKRRDYPTGHKFLCVTNHGGMATNFYDWEIQRFTDNRFPLTIQCSNDEEVALFTEGIGGTYTNNEPLNYYQTKYKEDLNKERKKLLNQVKAIGGGILLVICIFIILIINYMNKKTAKGDQPANYSTCDEIPSWVYGTWSVTTEYGTETIKIDDKGGILDLSSSGNNKTNMDYGSYEYKDGVIRARFPKDKGVVTTLPLDKKNKTIEYGGGYNFHKSGD